MAVLRQVDVELNHVRAGLDGFLEGRHGVLGKQLRVTPVGDFQKCIHAVIKPGSRLLAPGTLPVVLLDVALQERVGIFHGLRGYPEAVLLHEFYPVVIVVKEVLAELADAFPAFLGQALDYLQGLLVELEENAVLHQVVFLVILDAVVQHHPRQHLFRIFHEGFIRHELFYLG